MPCSLPDTATKCTWPPYFANSLFNTAVSCWQWGHHVANTSSSTGFPSLTGTDTGPPVADTLNFGASWPVFSSAYIGASEADFGVRELRAMAATTSTARMPIVA